MMNFRELLDLTNAYMFAEFDARLRAWEARPDGPRPILPLTVTEQFLEDVLPMVVHLEAFAMYAHRCGFSSAEIQYDPGNGEDALPMLRVRLTDYEHNFIN